MLSINDIVAFCSSTHKIDFIYTPKQWAPHRAKQTEAVAVQSRRGEASSVSGFRFGASELRRTLISSSVAVGHEWLKKSDTPTHVALKSAIYLYSKSSSKTGDMSPFIVTVYPYRDKGLPYRATFKHSDTL